jgi:hypothetical protein
MDPCINLDSFTGPTNLVNPTQGDAIPFPDGTLIFREDLYGQTNCAYTGTANAAGVLNCDGGFTVQCTQDPNVGATSFCQFIDGSTDQVWLKVQCLW